MVSTNMSTHPPVERPPRVFVAGMFHETNAFSPIPTGRFAFDAVFGHDPARSRSDRSLPGFSAMANFATVAGCEVIVSHYGFAQPSARPAYGIYTAVRDAILCDLKDRGPFDAVLYFLHGAQMAEGEDDCEGDLLTHTRALVGPEAIVAVELDLHANVSSAMTRAADIVLACREYPHTDFDARAEQLTALALAAIKGHIRPVTRFTPVPMMGLFHTTDPHLAALVAGTVNTESVEGIHAVSLIHGFAQANTPLVGAGVLIVADRDTETDRIAEALAEEFFAIRAESHADRKFVDEIVATIAAAEIDPLKGPLVVADYADNAGGGAGSDSTFLLEALLEARIDGVALGMIWDPVAVNFAHDAGVGASIDLRLGGKTGATAGSPLDVRATVTAVREDAAQRALGLELTLGRSAALEIDGIAVVVNSERQQVFSPTCFADHDIDLAKLRAVIVKSAQHFRAAFEPIARAILYCESPGVMNRVYPPERFDRVTRPIWPIDDIDWQGRPSPMTAGEADAI
jgi:microcystin degradation protein MlrC